MGPLGKGSSSPEFWRNIKRYLDITTYVSLNKLLGVMKPVFRSLPVVSTVWR